MNLLLCVLRIVHLRAVRKSRVSVMARLRQDEEHFAAIGKFDLRRSRSPIQCKIQQVWDSSAAAALVSRSTDRLLQFAACSITVWASPGSGTSSALPDVTWFPYIRDNLRSPRTRCICAGDVSSESPLSSAKATSLGIPIADRSRLSCPHRSQICACVLLTSTVDRILSEGSRK